MSIRTLMVVCTTALAAMTGFASSAAAQQSQAWTWCINIEEASLDLQISSCTTVIQSSEGPTKDLAIALVNRGVAYCAKAQHDRAIEDFDQAIKLHPNLAEAFYNRGRAYANKNQPDRAIQDYDQAIKLNPDHALAFKNRGNAYFNMFELDRAIQNYDQSIKLDASDGNAFHNRGVAYRAKGQPDRAI
jgi:tetratricopeptide (TPR) repeat protein